MKFGRRQMNLCAALFLCATLPAPVLAEGQITAMDYDEVAGLVPGHVGFATLPDRAYPGYTLNAGYAFAGGRIGEHFAGQTVGEVTADDDRFDQITGTPSAPLTVQNGPPGRNISISQHRAFGSNALYPLGPVGQPAPEGRGEGALSVQFTPPVCAVGIRIHTEYLNDLGTTDAHQGAVTIRFFAADGGMLDDLPLTLGAGISDLGFAHHRFRGEIAGVQIENRDPGGISVDDLRFGCQPETS